MLFSHPARFDSDQSFGGLSIRLSAAPGILLGKWMVFLRFWGPDARAAVLVRVEALRIGRFGGARFATRGASIRKENEVSGKTLVARFAFRSKLPASSLVKTALSCITVSAVPFLPERNRLLDTLSTRGSEDATV
jgi:hypothetical protein